MIDRAEVLRVLSDLIVAIRRADNPSDMGLSGHDDEVIAAEKLMDKLMYAIGEKIDGKTVTAIYRSSSGDRKWELSA